MSFVILGCGYTGTRVARVLLDQGNSVTVSTRNPEVLQSELPGAHVVRLDVADPFDLAFIPSGAIVLISIPTLTGGDPVPQIVKQLGDRPSRVVYLSTTGVYGSQESVDENTLVDPEQPRVIGEQAVLHGPWSGLVLRPAAIYGPGRGVHVSMQKGKWQLVGTGENYVSRIHVEDLSSIVVAALLNNSLTGAFPVADHEPCTSYEMTRFCADLLGLEMPQSIPPEAAHSTRRANRRVDGSAILQRLKISLKFPSYRSGVPASLTVS